MTRPIADAWFHRIKAATRDLVRACGGVVRAGEVAHISKTEVSRLQSATDPDVIGIAQALALEADCGVPYVTAVLADLNGRRLSDGPGAGGAAEALLGHSAELIRAAGEVVAGVARAESDGEVTATEAEGIDRVCGDLEARLATLRRALAARKGPRVVTGGRIGSGGL